MTRIGVIGAGAIGGSLGGSMALNGEDVTLVDTWRENVDTMRDTGLLLDGSAGEHRVEVNALHTDDLDHLSGSFDILIVAVKSYHTKWAVELMSPYIHEDTWVVSPQNSINELQIAPMVGAPSYHRLRHHHFRGDDGASPHSPLRKHVTGAAS